MSAFSSYFSVPTNANANAPGNPTYNVELCRIESQRQGCCQARVFPDNYPIQLNGYISPEEWLGSIREINAAKLSLQPILMVIYIVYALLFGIGIIVMIVWIATYDKSTTNENNNGNGSLTALWAAIALLGGGLLWMLTVGLTVAIMQDMRTRAAVVQQNSKYANSATQSEWSVTTKQYGSGKYSTTVFVLVICAKQATGTVPQKQPA